LIVPIAHDHHSAQRPIDC